MSWLSSAMKLRQFSYSVLQLPPLELELSKHVAQRGLEPSGEAEAGRPAVCHCETTCKEKVKQLVASLS